VLTYVLKRLFAIIPQVLVVAVATFVLLRLLPANPVEGIVGPTASHTTYLAEQKQLGLSLPVLDQLWHFLTALGQGRLGTSWQTNSPVRTEIGAHLPITLQLVVLALAVALLAGIPIGFLVATGRGRTNRVLRLYSLFAGSQPDFWWGLVFIYLFFYRIKIFPAPLGVLSPSTEPPKSITGFILIDTLLRGQFSTFMEVVYHLALPVLTLAFVVMGPIIRMTSEGIRAQVNADYILYARAMGLPRRRVAWYTARNGLAPVVTLTGVLFGVLLAGAVLIETVFSLNGLGVYTLKNVLSLNYPAIEASVLVMTAIALLVYIVMDILYALLDPRVRTA
jgi:ABC-type dipeptide/oligopeptide/nickel transport system permease component